MKSVIYAVTALVATSLTPAFAQSTQNASQLTAGAGWSSLYGPIGTAGIEVADFFGSGIDLSGAVRLGRKGYDTALSVGYSSELGALGFLANPEVFVTLDHTSSNWSDDAYTGQTGGASAGVVGSLGPIDVTAGGFVKVNKIGTFNTAASPLIMAERGISWTAGGMLGLGWDNFTGSGFGRTGSGVAGTFRVAPLGTRNFVSAELSAKTAQPLVEEFVLHVSGEAGAIRGLGGQNVSVFDRAFLGGAAPRGFGVAGIGPRDATGAIDSPLGGTNYLLGSVEVRRPVFERTALGAFVDAGSVWRLDGAPVGASGPIDDSYFLNVAVGAAFYWDTQIGTVNFAVAKPVRFRGTDQQNILSLNLSRSF
ncbi:BamA/TamA family outer membrane protein [Maritimibacter sp. DP1N21-5]|uniref:BamA/TamA family outer membrane protein n=1 Tax=Maritimibacter sp. DP1N21-5 TaxID=2836867 RepID=UPI001C495119|nr:BamA/TamA family outer membrane protein [Maritimibacter sp. DP1N21-5]MBV7407463.1 BamA/TamA family outer membrane protein [Maritimibacter sp. DP1N21-5]